MKLRPFQEEALAKLKHRHVTVLPTGTGKTAIFCESIVRAPKSRAVILVHREELIEQTVTSLRRAGYKGLVSLVQGSCRGWGGVSIAMQQTARLRPDEAPAVHALYVDEAHRYTTQLSAELLAAFEDKGACIYGFTATPAINGEPITGPGKPFVGISYRRTVVGMIREGYLCDARALTLAIGGLDLKAVKVSEGDYAPGALGAAMARSHAPERIVEAWEKHAKGRQRTLCFLPTVKLGQMVRAAFVRRGHAAEEVYGNTPKAERATIISRFRSGHIPILVNVVVGAEGFDVPEVDCVIQARPTKSWTLYTQMIGRGLRPAPGKSDLLVLDVAGSAEHHDLVRMPAAMGLRDLRGSVLDHIERSGKKERTEQELEFLDSQIELEETLLYSRIAWTQYGGEHLATVDQERLVVLCEVEGTWAAFLHEIATGEEQELLVGESAAAVQELTEDYVREHGDTHLTRRSSRWRQEPPSPAQASMLRRARWSVPTTRGEASEAITRLRYAQNRARGDT